MYTFQYSTDKRGCNLDSCQSNEWKILVLAIIRLQDYYLNLTLELLTLEFKEI